LQDIQCPANILTYIFTLLKESFSQLFYYLLCRTLDVLQKKKKNGAAKEKPPEGSFSIAL
jgi:hypothetical protein